MVADYWAIAARPAFLGYVLSATLTGAGLYVFLTGWPHVVIDMFGVRAAIFRLHFLLNGIGPDHRSARAPPAGCITVPRAPLFWACLVTNAVAGAWRWSSA